jgi:hypothetical protein
MFRASERGRVDMSPDKHNRIARIHVDYSYTESVKEASIEFKYLSKKFPYSKSEDVYK